MPVLDMHSHSFVVQEGAIGRAKVKAPFYVNEGKLLHSCQYCSWVSGSLLQKIFKVFKKNKLTVSALVKILCLSYLHGFWHIPNGGEPSAGLDE